MADPLANVPTLDVSGLAGPDRWAADVAEFEEWTAELPEPDDDTPDFDLAANPEVDVAARLAGDRSHLRRPVRRLFVDYRANPDAYRHLRRLPKDGESLHGIISGKYALFDLVAAIIERTGEDVSDLYLATLGFSKQNGADLIGMLEARQVRRVSLVCSYYFQKTSPNIYDAVVPELLKRRQRVKAVRSHCKLIVARMTGGARYVCESSANLRSCVNIEQFVLSRCGKLYAFHRRWLEEILRRGGGSGEGGGK